MPPDQLFTVVQRALAGQYSLEREIGRGGMGVVFLAREVELARLVALKVLPPELAADPAIRARFLREARTAAGLAHPHIVPIHRVAEAGDIVYFSMMFVEGETLGERLRARGPLSASAATRMLREIGMALGYAHGRGIVHRDIKPDNILLERESGRALVTDFGIAGTADEETKADGGITGTIHFMSPEQAAGLPLDGRSDLYSLGVLAHIALSGRLPSRAALAVAERGAPVSSLAIASPSTPRHLVAAVDRALALDPDARFATAEAFTAALDVVAVAGPVLPSPIRAWLGARDPWTAAYAIWSAGWLLSVTRGPSHSVYLAFALIAAVVPAIPAIVFELRNARRLLDSGYSLDDVGAALPAFEEEQREEQLARTGGRPAWVAPVARTAAWSAVSALLLLFWDAIPVPNLFGEIGIFLIILSAAASFPLLTALGVPILPATDRPGKKTLRQRLWDTPLGRQLERVLARGRRTLAPANAFRPTELALGSAVTDLWRSLPTTYREQLADLPDVVRRLELHASHARAVLVHLDGGTAAAPDQHGFGAVRDRARSELESTVTALESIRLDLLRLIGGDTDLAPTTTVLDAARRAAHDVERLGEAKREVERIVRPIGLDLTPHTPVS